MTAHLIQRCLHIGHGCLRARVPRRANPGMGYQLEQLRGQDAEDAAEEDYGNMESDFMSLHKTHREYEAEVQEHRDRVRQLMIKHKYFREVKLPNLLLHAEKEQMRLLHERDPEEWNVERLAESFPANPDIIKKVLRAKWKPRSLQRIRAHDESVIRNWAQVRAGKGDVKIPQSLLEHLEKFAQRKQQDLQQVSIKEWPTRPPLPVPQITEFRALVSDCSKEQRLYTQLTAGDKSELPPSAANDEETYLIDKVRNKRKMRLQELRELQLIPLSKPEEDREILTVESLPNPSGTGLMPNFVDKFQSNEIIVSAADQQRYEMSKVKDRIVIPRKLYRKGATYRVEDAYYDDDGEFLYRVPGMTGNS